MIIINNKKLLCYVSRRDNSVKTELNDIFISIFFHENGYNEITKSDSDLWKSIGIVKKLILIFYIDRFD